MYWSFVGKWIIFGFIIFFSYSLARKDFKCAQNLLHESGSWIMIKEVKELQKRKNVWNVLLPFGGFKYQFNWRLNENYHYNCNLLRLNLRIEFFHLRWRLELSEKSLEGTIQFVILHSSEVCHISQLSIFAHQNSNFKAQLFSM